MLHIRIDAGWCGELINRWNAEEPLPEALESLVVQSRLVGAEESLVLWGGGNNSIKVPGVDLLGRPLDVMYVKGSGSDMKSITADEYPAVRLDYVLALFEREAMADEDMVDFLARCLLDPKMRRPSIETLLHAFIPHKAVLHTHADSILAVTNTPGRESTVRECFGPAVLIVPYLRPGFALSRMVGLAVQQNPDAEGLVLLNHGLITWGADAREAYNRHLHLVSRAEAFAQATKKPGGIGVQSGLRVAEISPLVRGALSESAYVVLELDDSAETVAFTSRVDLRELTQAGPATPDHLLYTKRFPLLLDAAVEAERAASYVGEALQEYRHRYVEYFEQNQSGQQMLDADPRVVLIPGRGMLTVGKDARGARIVRDIYRHTMRILESAASIESFETLSDGDAFDAEYWPLELYKLTLLAKPKELAGQVAWITGATGVIGQAIARRLASEGAHVIITDLNAQQACDFAAELNHLHGIRRATAHALDVTSEAAVTRVGEAIVSDYGGLDILISNAGVAHVGAIDSLTMDAWSESLAVNTTGHFLVVRQAMRIMKKQGRGGRIVFNATKNVTAPGKDFGAYSVAKAAEAQLCRIVAIEGAEFGIRANMVNPDAIFEGSGIWSPGLMQLRADSFGVAVEALPEFYRNRNLLKTRVSAADVAEAVLFLASSRSSKTTGTMLPVDGGLREAFPR